MIQYNTRYLSLEQKKQLLCGAKDCCYNWWVDILDCSVSFRRQCIDMSWDEIMEKFDGKCYFNIIHRDFPPENYLEISFRTGGVGVDYFLWLQLPSEYLTVFCAGLSVM